MTLFSPIIIPGNSKGQKADVIILKQCIQSFDLMALLQQEKQQIIESYRLHDTDTGSADVQVALLTNRINQLSQHLQKNPKDFNSRRGLLMMIGRRKRLLNYIAKHSPDRFRELAERLNIRVKK